MLVMEFTTENLGEIEKRMQETMGSPKYRERMACYTELWITGSREILRITLGSSRRAGSENLANQVAVRRVAGHGGLVRIPGAQAGVVKALQTDLVRAILRIRATPPGRRRKAFENCG